MAKKIIAGKNTREPWGDIHWDLLFLYDITLAPVKNFNDDTVVPQTAANIPADAKVALSQAELDALTAKINAGEYVFQTVRATQTGGESDTDFLTRLEANHAVRVAWYVQRFRDMYAFVGKAIDF